MLELSGVSASSKNSAIAQNSPNICGRSTANNAMEMPSTYIKLLVFCRTPRWFCSTGDDVRRAQRYQIWRRGKTSRPIFMSTAAGRRVHSPYISRPPDERVSELFFFSRRRRRFTSNQPARHCRPAGVVSPLHRPRSPDAVRGDIAGGGGGGSETDRLGEGLDGLKSCVGWELSDCNYAAIC